MNRGRHQNGRGSSAILYHPHTRLRSARTRIYLKAECHGWFVDWIGTSQSWLEIPIFKENSRIRADRKRAIVANPCAHLPRPLGRGGAEGDGEGYDPFKRADNIRPYTVLPQSGKSCARSGLAPLSHVTNFSAYRKIRKRILLIAPNLFLLPKNASVFGSPVCAPLALSGSPARLTAL